MCYAKDWKNISLKEFKTILNEYLIWYNSKRIKMCLGFKNSQEYRQSLGII